MNRVYIAYGANLEQPLQQLLCARRRLKEALYEHRAYHLYLTPPWGGVAQPDFYNAVIAYDTAIDPEALLHLLQETENAQHRRRSIKNGPRTLDLDLLLYNDMHYHSPTLTLPHPRMHERAFVLQPLADIAPQLFIAPYGSVRRLLRQCDLSGQKRLAETEWDNFS